MNQRIAVIIAASLTAFVLVLVGGVAARMVGQTTASVPTTTSAQASAGLALDPTAQAVLAERDAAYQQALAEANARLEQANAQIARANAQADQASAQVVAANRQIADANAAAAAAAQAAPTAAPAIQAPAKSAYAVSAEQALTIAQATAPGATLTRKPDLVSFEGTPAYELQFDLGIIYVDANSGKLLYNGISTPSASTASAQISVEQAAYVAIAYRGGGDVVDTRLDNEHGALVYEVLFSDGVQLYVDATNGQVVYARLAYGEHEDGEHEDGEHEDGEHEDGEHEDGEHEGHDD